MPGNDYYKILGVNKTDPADQIKRAYRKLAKKYHPDRNPNNEAAEKQFKEVQQAYAVLGDAEKRTQYDNYGEAAVGHWGVGQQGEQVYQWGNNSSVRAEDLQDLFSAFGGGGQRSSVFDQIFSGRRRPRQARPIPQTGADEHRTMTLSFEQAIYGAVVNLQLRSQHNGLTEKLEVKIPPGVEEGQKIRLPGKGHPGANGGPPGDFYLVCAIGPHAYFRREGSSIHLEVPITVTEATLGATIEVPTLDATASVTIPPGTAGGTTLRLKGHGVPGRDGKSKGDQLITVQIMPPKELTKTQRRLFTELKKQEQPNPREACGWTLEPNA